MRERQEDATGASRTAPHGVSGGAIHPIQHRRGLIVATIAGVLMTIIGAFNTAVLPFGSRLAYWLLIMETGALIGIGASTGVRSWGRLASRRWLEGALVSLLIAVPLTMVVFGVTIAFFGGPPPAAANVIILFAMVLVVTGAITAVNYGTAQPPVVTIIEPVPPPAVSARARLLDRLPRHLREAEIHALEAEDHYLRVHTSAGSDLILLRMGDAIAELEGIDGARTHRSWWVARDAVQSVERADGRAELALPRGVVAPVSRSFARSLQDAGWFV